MPPTVSGYTTTYNCIAKNYPFRECIDSLLGFCDEVVVVDAGSTDGTLEIMADLSRRDSRVRFSVSPVDFSHPRWAIQMDGSLKAKARALCRGDYCWQTDTDEIVPPEDYGMIKQLPTAVGELIRERPVLYLPMVEFWGSFDTIRADFFSWKPRFSVNDKRITHGVPKEHALRDQWGFEYPRPFDSDSCNYVWADTRESVKMTIPMKVENFNMELSEYEKFFNLAIEKLPCVLHVSWFDLQRKIEHYREFWPKFHASMYNLPDPDQPERNVMFSKRWSDVSDADIVSKARELKELGPRTFHTKMKPGEKGKTIPYRRPIPSALKEWAARSTHG